MRASPGRATGWTDSLIAPRNTINYYEAVKTSLGAVENSVRLFMVPGMNHCQGGVGTATFDGLAALEAWVERKQAPSRIPASNVDNGVVTRTPSRHSSTRCVPAPGEC